MPSHEYMIAAQSADADENPVPSFLGCDAPTGTTVALVGPDGTDINPGVFPCFDYLTTGDLLDDNGVTWRFYAALTGSPDLSVSGPYEYIQHIFYGIDGKTNIIAPPTQVLTDIANGELAQVAWVEPDAAHSDIPGNNSNEGPDWVASVVNTVGASPFWNSTAILINWDDWGGLYDQGAGEHRRDGTGVPDSSDCGFTVRQAWICLSWGLRNGQSCHLHRENLQPSGPQSAGCRGQRSFRLLRLHPIALSLCQDQNEGYRGSASARKTDRSSG